MSLLILLFNSLFFLTILVLTFFVFIFYRVLPVKGKVFEDWNVQYLLNFLFLDLFDMILFFWTIWPFFYFWWLFRSTSFSCRLFDCRGRLNRLKNYNSIMLVFDVGIEGGIAEIFFSTSTNKLPSVTFLHRRL